MGGLEEDHLERPDRDEMRSYFIRYRDRDIYKYMIEKTLLRVFINVITPNIIWFNFFVCLYMHLNPIFTIISWQTGLSLISIGLQIEKFYKYEIFLSVKLPQSN